MCFKSVCSLASKVIMVLTGELFAGGHIVTDAGGAMDELPIATLTATLLHPASVG